MQSDKKRKFTRRSIVRAPAAAFASCWIAGALLGIDGAFAETRPEYPRAKTVEQVDEFFGTRVADPYRWMENTDDPELQAWVDQENALTHGYLAKVPFRAQLAKRLAEVQDYPRVGLPQKRGAWLFYTRNSGLQNQSVYYRQRGTAASGEVLLDPNTLSADGTVSVSTVSYTTDGKWMGYGLSQSGSDWETLHVREVASGKDRPDVLQRCRFTGIAWAPDNSGFYYSRYPDEGSVPKGDEEFWQRCYFHKLGEPQKKDRLVFERTDCKECGIAAAVSDDGKWLILHIWKGTAVENEIYVQSLGGSGGIEPLFTGFDAAWQFVESAGGKLYFLTNSGAPRKRIVAVDMAAGRKPEPIVGESSDVVENAAITNGRLMVQTMHNAHDRLLAYDLDGRPLGEVKLPTLGTVGGLSGAPADPELYVSFTSFLFPTQIYKYNFKSGSLDLHQEASVDFDRSAYVARQIFYESKDGTKVPMFLVHRRGIRLDGNNPVLLFGYGGFDISLTPSFSTSRLVWLEQGGIFAMPNLRGGGEFGDEWHAAGTLERKQNVFDDFIAAAEWLIDNDYTRPERLAIQGGSNGGLLTAACALQRPELYGAVLSQVPVIDMLRYHLFTIGAYWKPDYGDPANPEHFKALLAYSPAHNVKPGVRYPSMLVTTADTDTRVHPMHAKKFAAAVQAATTGDSPVLLRVETKAGHGAGKPVAKQIEEQADLYGFVMDRLGMDYVVTPREAKRGAEKK